MSEFEKNDFGVFESPFQALFNDSSTKQIGPMVLNLYDIEDYQTLIQIKLWPQPSSTSTNLYWTIILLH